MRHRAKSTKLGRTSAHRTALMASLVCHLIQERRITTTLTKAKAARSLAERMVTLGKRGTLAARRQAISRLHRKERVATLFDQIAPAFADRAGGYTRILKLGRRASDSSEMAILEWVDFAPPVAAKAAASEEKPEKPKAKSTKRKTTAAKKKTSRRKKSSDDAE